MPFIFSLFLPNFIPSMFVFLFLLLLHLTVIWKTIELQQSYQNHSKTYQTLLPCKYYSWCIQYILYLFYLSSQSALTGYSFGMCCHWPKYCFYCTPVTCYVFYYLHCYSKHKRRWINVLIYCKINAILIQCL